MLLLPSLDRKRAPAEYAHRVRAGFTRRDLARLFASRGYTSGAEIGVADGRYSLTLCETVPSLSLLCVDPWKPYTGNPRGGPQSQHDRNYELAQQRLTRYAVTFVQAKSMDAVVHIPKRSLDFVYIDGNHCLEYVLDDILHWAQRVRVGGIVAGHDFYTFKRAGVIEAVEHYTQAHNITDWEVCDEREPSFWWTVRA